MPYKGLIQQVFLLIHRLVALDSEGRYPSRSLLWGVVLALTIWLYWTATDYIDPSFNMLGYASVEAMGRAQKAYREAGFSKNEEDIDEADLMSSYTFYAGTPGGFYHALAQGLDLKWPGSDLDFTVKAGLSSAEIANLVYTNRRSFGIVQESILRNLDLPHNAIRIVAPIYDEHLHLICPRDSVRRYRRTASIESNWNEFQRLMQTLASDPRGVRTGSMPPEDIGPNEYIFIMGGQHQPNRRQSSIKKAAENLLNGDLAAMVVMAGAPMPVVKSALVDSSLTIVSLPVRLGPFLNEHLGIQLQAHDIGSSYRPEGQAFAPTITTYSSRAMLIASRDTPTWIIRRLGTLLNGFRQDNGIPSNESSVAKTSFPTGKYPFFTTIQEQYPGHGPRLLLMLLGLIMFVALVHWPLHNVFVSTISNSKEYLYSKKITEIYSKYLPDNQQLDNSGNSGIDLPKNYEADPHDAVKCLSAGISLLLNLAQSIRNDYLSGGIKVSHYTHLVDSVYTTKEIFHRHLARRLRLALLVGSDIPSDACERFYTAGYLLREDFESLQSLRIQLASGTVTDGD